MDQRIENIIREKRFIELTADERQLIEEWATTEEEFDQLKVVFSSVDALNQETNEKLNPTVKQRLDVRFKERYDQRRLVWYNKLWLFLWPEETGFVKKPLIQLAAVGLLVAIVTPFLFVNDPGAEQLALREETHSEEPLTDKRVRDREKSVNSSQEQERKLEGEKTKKEAPSKLKSVAPQEEVNPQEVTGIKDLEMSAPKDESIDQMASSGALQLSDDVAEREPEPASTDKVSDETFLAEQQVFAGVVSSESSEKSIGADSEVRTAKKVDQKETIDLLTALY